MCHDRGRMPPWNRDREHIADSETADDDLPPFLNERIEDDDEVEVLTDGGDDEEG